jgi:alkylation response protein AidB-like acyl-CoA dehydrogenase
MAGNSSVAAQFNSVVDDAARIGGRGEGQGLVFTAVAPVFLVGLAAVNVGIASAAVAAALEHASTRRYASGESLAEIQSVQHALAEMDTRTRAARLMVRDAARLGDCGAAEALVALMEAKVLATDTAASVTQTALEVCGGQGYTRALPVERHLRDARAGAVMAPTNGVLRNWIGKALAGLPVP